VIFKEAFFGVGELGYDLSNISDRIIRKFITVLTLMQLVSKTYMTRVVDAFPARRSRRVAASRRVGENTTLRHYIARLHRKTLCSFKSEVMLAHSIRLLIHYLRFWDVPVPSVGKSASF
jgi:hypothetical protein